MTVRSIEWFPSPNFWTGRGAGPPISIVIHTMAGTLAGCADWFRNPSSQVSSHYGVGLEGDVLAFVRTSDVAWANGLLEPGNAWPGPAGVNPNRLTVSIETEDFGRPDQIVTDEQYSAVLTLVRTIRNRHPSIIYLHGHDDISPRTRPHCPGNRWRGGRVAQLVADAGL